jgi:hypothetical protein
MATPAILKGLGFQHYEVNVRVLIRVAPRSRPEQDDLLGIDFVYDGIHHLLEESVRQLCHLLALSKGYSTPLSVLANANYFEDSCFILTVMFR